MKPAPARQAALLLLLVGLLHVLGAAGASRAVADDTTGALERAYKDARDDDARRRALKALGERRSPDAQRVLADALATDPSEPVRIEAVQALLRHGDEAAAQAVLQAINPHDPFVTEAVVAGLAKALPDKIRKWLLDTGLGHERAEIRAASIRILAAARLADLAPRLARLAGDAAPEVREAVALAVAHADPKIALPIAERFARDAEVRVRVASLASLGAHEGERAEKLLATAAEKDAAWQARLEAVRALAERAPKRSLDLLVRVLKDPKADRHVRLAALDGLAPLHEVAVLDALVALVSDGADRLDADIRRALGALTGEEIVLAAEWRSFWRDHKAGYQFPAARAARPGPPPAMATRSRFFDLPIESLRPCFVLDISGSMSEPMPVASGTATASAGQGALHTKIAVARAELKRALEALPKDASFGVILFADRMIPIEDRPVPARPDTIARALAQVDEYAPQGSTNLYTAFANILHGSGPRDPQAADQVPFDAIYLLTDGLPTSGAVTESNELRARIREFNRFARVRIHTIGIGDENRELLLGLAADSGGRCVQR